MFCGIRGTGKTSIAKILGKAVNCENPKDGNPCLECSICKGIADESLLNVIEIDAASNTSVDDIRILREDALYMPASGKYKVYIIDEVHMLSKNAFNALLKILEEPPKHVIFVLATTETQKIPPTILSRCQRFELKRIQKDMMLDRMKEYIKEENVQIDDKALEYITELSEGSMRDGLSILEQIISIKEGEKVTFEDVLDTLGNVDYDTYNRYTLALNENDVKSAIEIINAVYDSGKDMLTFASMYSSYLKNLVLLGSASNVNFLDMSDENAAMLKDIASKVNVSKMVMFLEEFLKAEKEMRALSMPKLALEVLTIRLCKSSESQIVASSSAQNIQVSATQNSNTVNTTYNNDFNSSSNVSSNVQVVRKEKARVANRVESISEGDLDALIGAWNAIVDATNEMTVRIKLEQVEILKLDGTNVYMSAALNNVIECVERFKERLENALPKINGKKLTIHIANTKKLEEAVTKENNKPKLDDNKIDDLTAQFAKTGVEVNIN